MNDETKTDPKTMTAPTEQIPNSVLAEKKKEEEAIRQSMIQRARTIVAQCRFSVENPSEQAMNGIHTINMLFEEFATQLAMILPDGFRTANCMDTLEIANHWAKKSLLVHDLNVRTSETAGAPNGQALDSADH